jgi:hypothetical protein
MKFLKSPPILLSLSFAVFAVGFDLAQSHSLLKSALRFLPRQDNTKVEIQSITITEIKTIGNLSTTKQTFSIPVPAEQDAQILGLTYGTTKILLLTQVKVVGGIDFQQITPSSIHQEGETIYITLPPPQVLDASLVKTFIYDYNRGVLGLGPDVGPQLQSTAQQRALQEAVQSACQNELLAQANSSATTLLENFIKLTRPQLSIQVKTTPPKDCQLVP